MPITPLDNEIIRVLVKAGQSQHLVEMTYTKKNGDTKDYTVEPYEFKEGFFWGWDIREGTIKKFFALNIQSATISDITFAPRFPVNF